MRLCVKIAVINTMRLQQCATIAKNAGVGYALNVLSKAIYVQNVALNANVGGMVSCRLRATFLSNYTELQAGGNA